MPLPLTVICTAFSQSFVCQMMLHLELSCFLLFVYLFLFTILLYTSTLLYCMLCVPHPYTTGPDSRNSWSSHSYVIHEYWFFFFKLIARQKFSFYMIGCFFFTLSLVKLACWLVSLPILPSLYRRHSWLNSSGHNNACHIVCL